jgi:hypothetical protein
VSLKLTVNGEQVEVQVEVSPLGVILYSAKHPQSTPEVPWSITLNTSDLVAVLSRIQIAVCDQVTHFQDLIEQKQKVKAAVDHAASVFSRPT